MTFFPCINSTNNIKSNNLDSWWDINWNYRKKIIITNSESDYQMQIKVFKQDGYDNVDEGIIDCENHSNVNFSDIRFIDNNNSLLPYWIEEIDTYNGDTYAHLWVKTPKDNNIFMYYGNPSAHHVSNSNDTFILFDDFNDNYLGEMWSIENVNGGLSQMYVSEKDQKLKFKLCCLGSGGNWIGKAVTADISLSDDFYASVDVSWRSDDRENVWAEFGLYNDEDYIARVFYADYSDLNGCIGSDPSQGQITGDSYTGGNTWDECEPNSANLVILREGGTINVYFQGEYLGSKYENDLIDNVKLIMLVFNYRQVNYVHFDNLIVRKYSSTQPYWESFESEQSLIKYYGDLNCLGNLIWDAVSINSTVTGNFTLENIGEDYSELSWEIESYPLWGTWTIKPNQGSGLKSDDEPLIVEISVISPNVKDQVFSGEIKIINSKNIDDYETIQVTLTTPRNILYRGSLLSQILEYLPSPFPIIRFLLQQMK